MCCPERIHGRAPAVVQLAEVGGEASVCEHLRFRDALRADADLRARYAALKIELVASGLDKAAYTAAKAPFIRAVLDACAAD